MDSIEYLQLFFPLNDVDDVVGVVMNEISKEKPLISIISIILGWYEDRLTNTKVYNLNIESADVLPILTWETFTYIYLDFINLIQPLSRLKCGHKVKESVIKNVADFVWSKVSKAFFKDKLHIQSLFSFLQVKQLDCFGIAITTLAILQYLGFEDVHLVLSEDHSWLSYDDDESAEITWHGKGNEEKRGKSIELGLDVSIKKCWLYLGAHGIKCSYKEEICAIVNAINPTINTKKDSEAIGFLQQKILWALHNDVYLERFSFALSNLADLEEINTTCSPQLTVTELHEKAITITKTLHENYLVYPYTYYGGYLYRQKIYDQAIKVWCQASHAVSRYNYSKEDEELYKEFFEITNTFLPNIVRSNEWQHLNQKEMCQSIIHFFANLSLWEEDSKTPIFHEQWAKSFLKVMSAFNDEIRVEISTEIVKNMEENDSVIKSLNKQPCVQNGSVLVDHNSCLVHEQIVSQRSQFFSNHTMNLNSKMLEIVKLCCKTKLNSAAIRLQLCAQTNTSNGKRISDEITEGRRKRSRLF